MRFSPFGNRAERLTGGKFLHIFKAIPANNRFHTGGQRVYNRNTDTVQTAGNFIRTLVEFTACMEPRQNQLQRTYALFWVNIDGNTASVIFYSDGIVFFQYDQNGIAIARHRFVDTVVDDFVDQMMQPVGAGRADIHSGAFADGVQPL